MKRIHAESPAIGNQLVMRFGNSRPQLSIRRLRRIGTKWHSVERREPDANRKLRRNRANTLHNFSQKSRAIFKTSTVLPFSSVGAQEFVPQITVAVLDVHEVETQLNRHLCRAMEFFDDHAYLSVAQNGIVARQSQFSIQDRMMIENAWFRRVMRIWTAVASGMRQLQSDEKPFVRTRRPPVFLHQCLSQSRQSFSRVPRNHELIRIRAPFVRNRNRFSSPDQFTAAAPEFFPAMDRMLARISIRSAVPSFHRMDGDPVADFDSAARKRPSQG